MSSSSLKMKLIKAKPKQNSSKSTSQQIKISAKSAPPPKHSDTIKINSNMYTKDSLVKLAYELAEQFRTPALITPIGDMPILVCESEPVVEPLPAAADKKFTSEFLNDLIVSDSDEDSSENENGNDNTNSHNQPMEVDFTDRIKSDKDKPVRLMTGTDSVFSNCNNNQAEQEPPIIPKSPSTAPDQETPKRRTKKPRKSRKKAKSAATCNSSEGSEAEEPAPAPAPFLAEQKTNVAELPAVEEPLMPIAPIGLLPPLPAAVDKKFSSEFQNNLMVSDSDEDSSENETENDNVTINSQHQLMEVNSMNRIESDKDKPVRLIPGTDSVFSNYNNNQAEQEPPILPKSPSTAPDQEAPKRPTKKPRKSRKKAKSAATCNSSEGSEAEEPAPAPAPFLAEQKTNVAELPAVEEPLMPIAPIGLLPPLPAAVDNKFSSEFEEDLMVSDSDEDSSENETENDNVHINSHNQYQHEPMVVDATDRIDMDRTKPVRLLTGTNYVFGDCSNNEADLEPPMLPNSPSSAPELEAPKQGTNMPSESRKKTQSGAEAPAPLLAETKTKFAVAELPAVEPLMPIAPIGLLPPLPAAVDKKFSSEFQNDLLVSDSDEDSSEYETENDNVHINSHQHQNEPMVVDSTDRIESDKAKPVRLITGTDPAFSACTNSKAEQVRHSEPATNLLPKSPPSAPEEEAPKQPTKKPRKSRKKPLSAALVDSSDDDETDAQPPSLTEKKTRCTTAAPKKPRGRPSKTTTSSRISDNISSEITTQSSKKKVSAKRKASSSRSDAAVVKKPLLTTKTQLENKPDTSTKAANKSHENLAKKEMRTHLIPNSASTSSNTPPPTLLTASNNELTPTPNCNNSVAEQQPQPTTSVSATATVPSLICSIDFSRLRNINPNWSTQISHSRQETQTNSNDSATDQQPQAQVQVERKPKFKVIFRSYLEDEESPLDQNINDLIKEAIRRKRTGDAESNMLKQGSWYLEAIVYYLMACSALERDRQTEVRAGMLYDDTLQLIRYTSKKFSHLKLTYADGLKDTFGKMEVFSLRCQALTELRLYKLCRNGFTQNVKYHRNDNPATSRSAIPPSSSVSPQDSQHKISAQKLLLSLTASHDLWDEADNLVRNGNYTDFFISLERVNGPLTLHSSIYEVFRYVQAGLKKI